MLELTFILLLLSLFGYTNGAAVNATDSPAYIAWQCAYWPGWHGIKNIFSFGDSYTTTGFVTSGDQPSVENPMGNPPFPYVIYSNFAGFFKLTESSGFTSSNGPNWIGYLVTKYNTSTIFSYNLAFGGATVDSNLATPILPGVHSLIQQVNSDFFPVYGNGTKRNVWSSNNSLFTVLIGINDILITYNYRNATVTPMIFAQYSSALEKLYSAGARNFLILDVPAIQNSPLSQATTSSLIRTEISALQDWQTRIANMTYSMKQNHPDITISVFSSYKIFEQILAAPTVYQQTSDLKNLTGYCLAYSGGTPQANTYVSGCTVPVDEYFWLNSLHPTFPVHDALAYTVSNSLASIPNSNILCNS